MTAIEDALLQIGEVAKRAGVSVRTVRYYEEMGLLPPSGLTSGGIRLYSQRDVTRLRFVRHLKALGMTIEEIKMTLGVSQPAPAGRQQRAERTLELLRLQKARVRDQMAEFARLENDIDKALAHVTKCLACSAQKCPAECPSLEHLL